MKIQTPLLFLWLALTAFPLFSQTKNYRNEIGFTSDNDAYLGLGNDRYYTNGLFINYRHALKGKGSYTAVKKIWEIEFGQYLFNPSSGSVTEIEKIDRPFAAFLYGDLKLNWYYKNEEKLQVSLGLGTIGPSAKGKEVQEVLHHVVGFYDIHGWEYQVDNEFAVNSSLRYTKLLDRSLSKNTDLSFQGVLNVGNTFSGTGAAVLFRTGKINPLDQSVSTDSRITNKAEDAAPQKELFFFARPFLYFTAYDATVQGGMFTSSKGPVVFKPKRLVFSQELGLSYSKDRWTLNFSVIFKSKVTKAQKHSHQYGSAGVYYRLN